MFRHHDAGKEPHRLEVKPGGIDKPKNKIEFLITLSRRIFYGLSNMNINSLGNCCI